MALKKDDEGYLWVNFVPFQDKADISESTGAFQTHDTKDFHQASQQHQQQQQQSSSVSPSMKQPGQQQEGGPSTGQHANVIIPRGGRRPSGKQVFSLDFHLFSQILINVFLRALTQHSLTVLTLALSLLDLFSARRLFFIPPVYVSPKTSLLILLFPVFAEPNQVLRIRGISVSHPG